VLKNQCFETGPVNFCRGIQRSPGTDGTEDAGIEKKKLGVLYDPPPGVFLERRETNADEKILKNSEITFGELALDPALTGNFADIQ